MSEAKKESVRFMDDISALAGIDVRGPATDGEAKAAIYVSKRMDEMGLNPSVEPFPVCPHFPMAWALHFIFAIAACFLAVTHPWIASLIVLLLMISYYGDTTTKFYWVRSLLPKHTSRHVIGKLKAKGERKKTVVIAAHMDAGQMGMSMEPKGAERTTTFFKRYFNMQPPILFLLVFALTLTLAATVYWGLHGSTLIGQRLMIAAVIGNLVATVIFTQMEFAGISPGANDNASGVATMLELARRLKDDPMEETEIWFLGVGSEETYMNGMAKFMDDRRPLLDKDSFYFLVPESCGFGRPRIVTGEGVYKTDYHDPALVGAAFLAAKRRGYPEVTPLVLRTGGTDATPPTVRGYKAVCILAMNENDYVPHYHWKTDLPEYIDTRALEKTSDIFEETIRIIDTEF